MNVRTTKFGTVVLTAEEGKVLLGIDGGTSKEVYLAKSDSPENYEEIDEPTETMKKSLKNEQTN